MSKLQIPINTETKALIFDIDGTLLDTMPIHYKACQIVCKEYGFEFPLDYFYQTAGAPTHEVFEALGKQLSIDIDFQQAAFEKEEKYKEFASEIKIFPEMAQILSLYKNKLPMACGTGATREIALLNLKAANLEDFFQTVITCEDVSFPKPHPETFLKAARALSIPPANCQVFEDGDYGLQAAKTAGMMATDIRQYIS